MLIFALSLLSSCDHSILKFVVWRGEGIYKSTKTGEVVGSIGRAGMGRIYLRPLAAGSGVVDEGRTQKSRKHIDTARLKNESAGL